MAVQALARRLLFGPTCRRRAGSAITPTAFDTVEINNSFYRLPEATTFAKWRDQAPRRFLYAVKASRFLTHMKKLKDPEDPLFRFFENVRELGSCLGPVLYQLPPRWPINLERFEHFLSALPSGYRHTVEFREPSWYDDRIYELMRRHKVALCLHDMQGSATEPRIVGPFVYVASTAGRHTPAATKTNGSMNGPTGLQRESSTSSTCSRISTTTSEGHAPRDAVRLRDRIHARLPTTALSVVTRRAAFRQGKLNFVEGRRRRTVKVARRLHVLYDSGWIGKRRRRQRGVTPSSAAAASVPETTTKTARWRMCPVLSIVPSVEQRRTQSRRCLSSCLISRVTCDAAPIIARRKEASVRVTPCKRKLRISCTQV
jgi:hypothetical protein